MTSKNKPSAYLDDSSSLASPSRAAASSATGKANQRAKQPTTRAIIVDDSPLVDLDLGIGQDTSTFTPTFAGTGRRNISETSNESVEEVEHEDDDEYENHVDSDKASFITCPGSTYKPNTKKPLVELSESEQSPSAGSSSSSEHETVNSSSTSSDSVKTSTASSGSDIKSVSSSDDDVVVNKAKKANVLLSDDDDDNDEEEEDVDDDSNESNGSRDNKKKLNYSDEEEDEKEVDETSSDQSDPQIVERRHSAEKQMAARKPKSEPLVRPIATKQPLAVPAASFGIDDDIIELTDDEEEPISKPKMSAAQIKEEEDKKSRKLVKAENIDKSSDEDVAIVDDSYEDEQKIKKELSKAKTTNIKDERPLSGWSPNVDNNEKLERARNKIKQKEIERLKLEKKTQLIKLNDSEEEDVKPKTSGFKQQQQQQPQAQNVPNAWDNLELGASAAPRFASTQMQNRNYAFEDKLKELSDGMLEVMETKPNPNDEANYSENLKTKLKGLRVKLMPHQLYALKWLKWREANYPNGSILADDMGLGKTFTTLAFLKLMKDEREHVIKKKLKEMQKEAEEEESEEEEENSDAEMYSKDLIKKRNLKKTYTNMRSADNNRLRTLIILPASLLHQWENEIKSKFEAGSFKYHCYHETNRAKYSYNMEDNDIVFTTYEIVTREVYVAPEEKDGQAAVTYGRAPTILEKIPWKRIVLDEAHRIKNHTTKTCKAVCALKAKHRLALTGTPIHNSITDLYSLCKFLHFTPMDDIGLFKYVFSSEMLKSTQNNSTERQRRSESWMIVLSNYLILRRAKDDKLNQNSDRPIVQLSGKTVETVDIELNREEKAIYDQIFADSQERVNDILKNQARRLVGTMKSNGGANMSEIFVYLMRLRQACIHMSLLSECLDKEELQKIKLETEGIEGMMSNMTLADASNVTTSSLKDDVNVAAIESNVNLAKCLKKSYKSSKITKVLEIAESILDENPNDKIIIVSQFVKVLSLISCHLDGEGIDYCEIKGDVNIHKRNDLVEEFNSPSNRRLRVMLLSLTAGGVGLNLMGANHMLLIDIHWNPALESQCSDRIYRVGQRKPCTIYKFLCKNTIEERIRALQEKKIDLAKRVVSGAAASEVTANITGKTVNAKLTHQDLKLLFSGFDNNSNK